MAYFTRIPVLVDATSMRNPDYSSGIEAGYYPQLACNTSTSLTGPAIGNSWISLQRNYTKQRIWSKLSIPYIITRLYYENYHDSHLPADFDPATTAGDQQNGAYEGSIWASNIQPEAYGTYVGLVKLWEGKFEKHSSSNVSDPHNITFVNITPYQYYIIDVINNYSGSFGIGFRRIEWQENI